MIVLFRVFAKILVLLTVPVAVSLLVSRMLVVYDQVYTIPLSPLQDQNVVLAVPMRQTNWKDLGVVPEPLVTLDIETVDGYREHTFLVDSGAVISSLPREWAELTGQDLAFLPRSTFGGFGGKTSVAYRGSMVVLLGGEKLELPVVFTEAAGTKSLLGRKEFFQRFTVAFPHETNQTEIRK